MPGTRLRRLGGFDALLLASLLWFLAKLLRYAFPPLFESLQGAYGVSNATVGTAFTGFMLAYALMQFPSGLLADRLGSVRVIVAGAALAGIGAVAVLLEGTFLVLVAAMVVMGAGTGAHKTVAIELLSRIYPARTGRVLGIFDTVGTFGGVVAPVAVAGVLAVEVAGVGWRTLFLVAGIGGFALAGAFAVSVPRRVPDGRQGRGGPSPTLGEYAAPFRDRQFSAFVAVTLCFGFAYNGTVAFLPLYLIRELGLATATASLLYGLLFAVSVVQIGTGEVSDRVGRLPVIVGALSLAGVSLAALLALPGAGPTVAGVPVAVAAAVAGLGIGSHGFRPVRGAHLTAILPESLAGGGLGVVRTLLMGAGAIAPAVIGAIADVAGFRVAFWVLLAALLAATALAAVLWLQSGE